MCKLSAKPIDPLELKPKEIQAALEQLPESLRSKISGITKLPESAREDQSPEAIQKANLRAMKAHRRDIIASLVDLEKEIFLAEDRDYNNSLTPVVRRQHILAALEGTEAQLGRRNMSLSEVRGLFPHEGISFGSWISELSLMHQEGCIYYFDELIILPKSMCQRSA